MNTEKCLYDMTIMYIKSIYDTEVANAGVRVKKRLNTLREYFTTDEELYCFLVQFTDGFIIDHNLLDIGKKTFSDIKNIVLKYRDFLELVVNNEMTENNESGECTMFSSSTKNDIWQGLNYIFRDARRTVDLNTRVFLSCIRYTYKEDEYFYTYLFRFIDEENHPDISKKVSNESLLQVVSIANKLREGIKINYITVLHENNQHCINWEIIWTYIKPIINNMSRISRYVLSVLFRKTYSYSRGTGIDFFLGDNEQVDISGFSSKNRNELNVFLSIIKNIVPVKLDSKDLSFIERLQWLIDGVVGLSVFAEYEDIKNKLGHSPVFKAIEEYISNMSPLRRNILLGLVNIYEGQTFRTEGKLSEIYCVPLSGIVNKKSLAINSINKFIVSLLKKGYIDLSYYTFDKAGYINKAENTKFSEEFTYWIINVIEKDKERSTYLSKALLDK